jgi:general stress protein 26
MNEEIQDLKKLIEHMKVGMLTTIDDEGGFRSRPLWTLDVDDQGRIWFFVSSESRKIHEMLAEHDRVGLSYADLAKQDYVSITGHGEIMRDEQKMKELWNPWVKAFFPRGLNDPDLALLAVTIDKAEYWDAPGSLVKRLQGMLKARATGDTGPLGDHQKIDARDA